MNVAQQIKRRLEDNFTISDLDIIDESHKHIGHSGYREGGETHFRIKMSSPDFIGMSRLEKQRRIHTLLKDLLETRIHALSLDLKDA